MLNSALENDDGTVTHSLEESEVKGKMLYIQSGAELEKKERSDHFLFA
jgi:hypothetical protein